MSFWFDYVQGQIEPDAIRGIAKLDDEAIKIVMSAWICKVAGGIELPTKTAQIEIAKILINIDRPKKTIMKVCNISERHYFRLKKEVTNGKN